MNLLPAIRTLRSERQSLFNNKQATVIRSENPEQFFLLGRQLGKGSYGWVYGLHVIDPVTGNYEREPRYVAKYQILRFREEATQEDISTDLTTWKARSNTEAEIARESGYDVKAPIFIKDSERYHKALTISENLGRPLTYQRIQRLSLSQRFQLIQQLAMQLSLIHEKTSYSNFTAIHADIKPENILMDSQGRICFVDFGLSFRSETRNKLIRHPNLAQGHAFYFPPETENHQFSVKSDVYMFTNIAIHLLSNQKKLRYRHRSAVEHHFPSNSVKISGRFNPQNFNFHQILIGFLNRMQSPDYQKRPDTDEVIAFFNAAYHYSYLIEQPQDQSSNERERLKEIQAKLILIHAGAWQTPLEVVEMPATRIATTLLSQETREEEAFGARAISPRTAETSDSQSEQPTSRTQVISFAQGYSLRKNSELCDFIIRYKNEITPERISAYVALKTTNLLENDEQRENYVFLEHTNPLHLKATTALNLAGLLNEDHFSQIRSLSEPRLKAIVALSNSGLLTEEHYQLLTQSINNSALQALASLSEGDILYADWLHSIPPFASAESRYTEDELKCISFIAATGWVTQEQLQQLIGIQFAEEEGDETTFLPTIIVRYIEETQDRELIIHLFAALAQHELLDSSNQPFIRNLNDFLSQGSEYRSLKLTVINRLLTSHAFPPEPDEILKIINLAGHQLKLASLPLLFKFPGLTPEIWQTFLDYDDEDLFRTIKILDENYLSGRPAVNASILQQLAEKQDAQQAILALNQKGITISQFHLQSILENPHYPEIISTCLQRSPDKFKPMFHSINSRPDLNQFLKVFRYSQEEETTVSNEDPWRQLNYCDTHHESLTLIAGEENFQAYRNHLIDQLTSDLRVYQQRKQNLKNPNGYEGRWSYFFGCVGATWGWNNGTKAAAVDYLITILRLGPEHYHEFFQEGNTDEHSFTVTLPAQKPSLSEQNSLTSEPPDEFSKEGSKPASPSSTTYPTQETSENEQPLLENEQRRRYPVTHLTRALVEGKLADKARQFILHMNTYRQHPADNTRSNTPLSNPSLAFRGM